MRERISKRERRLAWKQAKKERREALKDYYRYAPWFIRIPRLYLLKPFIALVLIAAVVFAAYRIIPNMAMEAVQANKNAPVEKSEIEKLAPTDEEGAKRIDSVAPVGKNDTWTISVYMIGADLEDMNENELSAVVMKQIDELSAETQSEAAARRESRLENFTNDMNSNGLEMPAYLYYPSKSARNKQDKESDNSETEAGPGCASTDIDEMTAEVWSDNITLVIQTGGATRWSNAMVNPNRTQRFTYHKGELKEVYDAPVEKVTDPKTLTSFLNFSRKEYPADHNMLVLWNHGSGSFGYGYDSICGGTMSLKDVREALEGAFEPNIDDPAFDVIGFDACLMSSLEVTHALDGFASYYALSEEAEPGEGWNYTSWLRAMSKDPTMSPANVVRHIADSYMDYYMTQNVNMGWIYTNAVTFSVVDAAKCKALYDAWCDLMKKQLVDAVHDNSVLAEIGRCSDKSTHYVPSAYNAFNTIDLGNYVDQMVDDYPEESSRIKELLNEAVMYHRENGWLSDSNGINVYLPGSVEDYGGLMMCLQYIYEVCDDPATQALYYYKVAGCLNEDMKKYLATITDEQIKTLDLEPYIQFKRSEPVAVDEGFEIPIDEKLQDMLQSYDVEVAYYDDEGRLINYGRDELARLDGEWKLVCEFDGTWICLDGVPLATELVSSTGNSVEYRSKVSYNGKEAYLSFFWDRDTEKFSVDGVRGVSDVELAGGIINEMDDPDPIDYLMNTRMVTRLKEGDVIVPIYHTDYTESASEGSVDFSTKAKHIIIGKKSEISTEKLPDGYYLTSAVISDYRGDTYYSQVVGNKISGGKVSERKVDADFVGRDY